MVALEQRRLEEAEAHYRKALEIFLEFGDRQTAAKTYSQLGILLTEAVRPIEAVAFSLEALELRRESEGSWSELDLRWLKRQRRLLGDTAFEEALDRHAPELRE